ncbi:uncharacterized protein BDR25DRAFT_376200 [Lindgomyces ingoldianus]|uniref:Uncharacterized protein n=1 Tax=Lindgomyces ingoldianus TaxID=673940 RepID=A0ACB6QJT4_9PLEO|nr:uncharacterized protein BDR25DRAFT_376200 [Lindgomyces ingoldianus]KAF2467269.1 hypothetical protein BDR25DRAFT_376200 [Lindgomyces ingoldianus]
MLRSKRTAIGAIALLASVTFVNSLPSSPKPQLAPRAPCADVKGTFSINQLQLYPENADFDFHSCLLYIGSLFNASVAVYDPYAKTTSIIEVPDVTHNQAYHLGGVAANPYTNLISIVVDAGAAFNTGGSDISGTNLLILWDPATKTEVYRLNLTTTTHGTYGGFQDVEFDSRGNVYVVGTFPSSILRVEGNGSVVNEWYISPLSHTITGYSGLAAVGSRDVLIANDNANKQLVRFDMSLPKGIPIPIPVSPPKNISGSDAIYLPPKYAGTILLAAVDASGIEVLRSKDASWTTAESLGQVSNKVSAANGGFVTAPVQIGNSIFMVEEFFGDAQPGTRTQFPFVDITEEVEKLVGK